MVEGPVCLLGVAHLQKDNRVQQWDRGSVMNAARFLLLRNPVSNLSEGVFYWWAMGDSPVVVMGRSS
jgi:hypothetical protein